MALLFLSRVSKNEEDSLPQGKVMDKLSVFCDNKKDFCKSFRISPINTIMQISVIQSNIAG